MILPAVSTFDCTPRARVVGAFNTVWSNVIIARIGQTDALSMFYVSDDREAKTVAAPRFKDDGGRHHQRYVEALVELFVKWLQPA